MIVPLQFGKHSNYSFLYILGNAREQMEEVICITW